ncbi:MAG: DinB family protein [Ignavibacteriales bacterium]|nr:DinB family protein [Ignavibacteriales bacterium]
MNRKELNRNQTRFRDELLTSKNIAKIKEMFLRHHAQLHSTKVNNHSEWSYEDEILRELPELKVRFIPQKSNHSIAWCLWHLARVEDVTMNILVDGGEQILRQNNWLQRMNTRFISTGNGMLKEEVEELSVSINIEELKKYRIAVGKQTQSIVKDITMEKLKEKISGNRIERLYQEGALIESAKRIGDYWSKKNVAGLLLMPATRHNILHLNEANNLSERQK